MSFSREVKEELALHVSPSRHCQIAELSAIIMMCGKMHHDQKGGTRIIVQTENMTVARKYFTLLRKTFNIYTDVCVRTSKLSSKTRTYLLVLNEKEDVEKLIGALKLDRNSGNVSTLITGKSCCKRAFIRGVFLTTGSISDPEKFYHFEIVCDTSVQAEAVQTLINSFGIDSKIVPRKKHYVVYIKEGAQIVDMLNIMEAHVSLMKLENLRIVKEMRNSVNRRVNCETANIHKTVSAAVKQLEDIRYIKEKNGFSELSEGLLEMAELRLHNPDATLKELGEMADPPVGKSGVNHRLRKLSEYAEKLRGY
ncbi:DNA-binding protein WhiA [bacterium C-53]|nr:DNA-binding protein WhiA [Lachnospiraceae bacterium]NBI03168.1 DNA-binding protein WhiA [Lachnospiraceae bacterium]RKJ10061.1 DNA-binding protein WhiA [bacterium C-53]